MKVFLSFSGPYSKKHAEAFKKLLTHVIQTVEVFISPDIKKGKDWYPEIMNFLKEADYSVIFLSRGNQNSNWINFEAGAIRVREIEVSAILLNINASEISQPLNQMQHTKLEEKEIKELIRNIHDSKRNKKIVDINRISDAFDRYWPDYKASVDKIKKEENQPPKTEDLMEAISVQNENTYELLQHLRKETNKILLNNIQSYKRPDDFEEDYLKNCSLLEAEIIRLYFGINREYALTEKEIAVRFDLEEQEVIEKMNSGLSKIKL